MKVVLGKLRNVVLRWPNIENEAKNDIGNCKKWKWKII